MGYLWSFLKITVNLNIQLYGYTEPLEICVTENPVLVWVLQCVWGEMTLAWATRFSSAHRKWWSTLWWENSVCGNGGQAKLCRYCSYPCSYASELRHVFWGNYFANSTLNDLPNNFNSCFFPTKNLLYCVIADMNIFGQVNVIFCNVCFSVRGCIWSCLKWWFWAQTVCCLKHTSLSGMVIALLFIYVLLWGFLFWRTQCSCFVVLV